MEAVTAKKGASTLSARVLKAMSVFGGVQAVQIVCSVVRTKLIAVWIGAAAVGLFGILLSAVEMISTITRFGIEGASVRDIAADAGNSRRLALTARVVRRLGLWAAILGALAMVVASPWLSLYSFDTYGDTWMFMALALCVVLGTLQSTETAILQGLGRLSRLAKATVRGTIAGLILTLPLFYFFRLQGVLPSMLVYSVVTFVAVISYREKLPSSPRPVSARYTAGRGRPIITLGIFMTLSGFVTSLVSYIFLSWLSGRVSIIETGYYQSGYSLISKYANIMLSAVAVEYYPRLSTMTGGGGRRMSLCVAHEASLLLWLLLPVVPAFVLAAPIIVPLLYDSSFMPMLPFITVGIVSVVPRAVSWCMAFTMLAKGDGAVYLLTEVISMGLCLALNICFYSLWGLSGLGFSFVVWYLAYLAMVWIVYRFRYHLSMPKGVVGLSAAVFAVCAASAAVAWLWPNLWWVNIIVTAVAAVIAFRHILSALKRRKKQ